MKINSWYLTLGIVGAAAVVVVACTSNTTVNNNGTGEDAGTDDSSTTTTEPDSAADTGTTTTTPDTGTTTTPDTGASTDAGVVCEVPDGSDACDTCALTNCCAQENTCQSEAAADGGTTDCEDIFSCVQDCLAPPADSGVDAGMISDCTTTCGAGHTATGMTDFTALSSCLATSCSSQCQ